MDPLQANIEGVRSLVESDTNKNNGTAGGGGQEGPVGERINVLELPMSDEALLKLRDEYEKVYAPYESKIKEVFRKNKESYLGKTAEGQWLNGEETIVANLQFEAEETFLAAALAKNPEPVVYADNSPEGNKVSDDVKTMLAFHADQLNLRRKLAIMVRQWSIYQLGVLKLGWKKFAVNGEENGDVSIENRKIQNFVFDPNGHVDAHGHFSSWLGERVTVTAERLVEMFPKHKAYIILSVAGRMGTKCTYTEWWTDEFCFYTYKEVVLEKHKNEYFKYQDVVLDALGNETLDDLGNPILSTPKNHFAEPRKPYIFLSVFSLQEQPHDITGLIEQNIPNQNRIARGTNQLDYNVSASNNGYAYSQDNFNEQTAKQAAEARRKGNPILVPSGGPIDRAILPLAAQDLPQGFFANLENHKNDLRTSWGVQGILATPQDEDQTARGMILNQSHDTTRIGGGIGQSLETVAKATFNWLVQLYYVFYDEKHFAAIMGSAKAVEYVELSSENLDRQLIVTVSPDSLKPKDEITQINLAQALFDKKAIGPKTLLKMIDFPNPDEAAADGVLYATDPAAYFRINFPEEFAKLQMAQMEQMQMQAQGAMPSEQGVAPEATTEPEKNIARDPASAALSQVPI